MFSQKCSESCWQMFEEKSRSLSQEKVKDVSEDELKSHWSCDQVSAQAQQVALQRKQSCFCSEMEA